MHFANQRLQCPLFSYGQKVTSVDYSSPTKVKVKALSGNTYIASYVISTLPLGVMQKNVVAWTPSLPADKAGHRPGTISTCMAGVAGMGALSVLKQTKMHAAPQATELGLSPSKP